MEDHKAVETSIQSPQKRHKDSADRKNQKGKWMSRVYFHLFHIREKNINQNRNTTIGRSNVWRTLNTWTQSLKTVSLETNGTQNLLNIIQLIKLHPRLYHNLKIGGDTLSTKIQNDIITTLPCKIWRWKAQP